MKFGSKKFRIKYELLPLNLYIDVDAPTMGEAQDVAMHLGYDALAGASLVKYVVHTVEEIGPPAKKRRR